MAQTDRKRVEFVLVGGFLGAGKTTTLCELAKRIAAGGQRVGLITNDQAAEQVDTGVVKLQGLPVAEIAGGCFCCRFQDLVAAGEEILAAVDPDVLLAEPVGSCTDLSATVLQPLKKFYGEWFTVLPYSVLVDPARVDSTLLGELKDSDIGYLFRKQLEEADLIVLNKIDTLDPEGRRRRLEALREAFGETPVYGFSARTGEGFEEWWRAVRGGGQAGSRILEVDYDTYAEAEAALGWLNATVALSSPGGFDGAGLTRTILAGLHAAARERSAEIGHIKMLLSAPGGAARCALVSTTAEIDCAGSLPERITEGTLTINARVTIAPEDLERLVRDGLAAACDAQGVTPTIHRLESFRPGRPNPTHRFAEVVV